MPLLPPKKGKKQKRPSMKGVAMFDVSSGKERSRKWPIKRDKRRSGRDLAHEQWFRNVQWAFKYSDSKIQGTFRDATAGTPFMPRDLFTSLFAERLIIFNREHGGFLVTEPILQEVSKSLDVLGVGVGSTLVRGTRYWGIAPMAEVNRYAVRVLKTSNQSLASGQNSVEWSLADFDDLGCFDVAHPRRLTVPAGVNRIELTAQVRAASNDGNSTSIRIVKNGVTVIAQANSYTGWGTKVDQISTGPVSCVPGDYFTVRVEYSSVSGLLVQPLGSFFSATMQKV